VGFGHALEIATIGALCKTDSQIIQQDAKRATAKIVEVLQLVGHNLEMIF
jgi:hypothetical protein